MELSGTESTLWIVDFTVVGVTKGSVPQTALFPGTTATFLDSRLLVLVRLWHTTFALSCRDSYWDLLDHLCYFYSIAGVHKLIS